MWVRLGASITKQVTINLTDYYNRKSRVFSVTMTSGKSVAEICNTCP